MIHFKNSNVRAVISAAQEAEIGESWSEANPSKARHCLKKQARHVIHACNPSYLGSGGKRTVV
jgi:hypothetical protein